MKVKVSINEVVQAVAAHLGTKATLVSSSRNEAGGAVQVHEVELDCEDITQVVRFLRKGQSASLKPEAPSVSPGGQKAIGGAAAGPAGSKP